MLGGGRVFTSGGFGPGGFGFRSGGVWVVVFLCSCVFGPGGVGFWPFLGFSPFGQWGMGHGAWCIGRGAWGMGGGPAYPAGVVGFGGVAVGPLGLGYFVCCCVV